MLEQTTSAWEVENAALKVDLCGCTPLTSSPTLQQFPIQSGIRSADFPPSMLLQSHAYLSSVLQSGPTFALWHLHSRDFHAREQLISPEWIKHPWQW